MKKGLIAISAIVVLAGLTAAYLWGPAAVPAGQEPLTVLSNANLREFASAFDRDANIPRLVLLLSPT